MINAPFTEEQVAKLNEYQTLGFMHPFTCGGEYCTRGTENNWWLLIATPAGWVCPCGKYKQSWAHTFMLEINELKKKHAEQSIKGR